MRNKHHHGSAHLIPLAYITMHSYLDAPRTLGMALEVLPHCLGPTWKQQQQHDTRIIALSHHSPHQEEGRRACVEDELEWTAW